MLEEHHYYVSDSVRIGQFKSAIRGAVKTSNRVADLGCGSGILGLLCLEAGASLVYDIDSGRIIEVAKETFLRAGLDGRAGFIKGKSQQISLPERVDVIICDHLGYFGFDYGIVSFLEDAGERFLKPDGTAIPARIKLLLALVDSKDCHHIT